MPTDPPRRSAAPPPLTFVVDYDGTICLTQVTDVLMDVTARAPIGAPDERYMRNEIGSRESSPSHRPAAGRARPIVATAAAQPRRDVPGFVEAVRRHGLEIEVVADGWRMSSRPSRAR
jgi:hypothetical protein